MIAPMPILQNLQTTTLIILSDAPRGHGSLNGHEAIGIFLLSILGLCGIALLFMLVDLCLNFRMTMFLDSVFQSIRDRFRK